LIRLYEFLSFFKIILTIALIENKPLGTEGCSKIAVGDSKLVKKIQKHCPEGAKISLAPPLPSPCLFGH